MGQASRQRQAGWLQETSLWQLSERERETESDRGRGLCEGRQARKDRERE